MRSNTQRTIVPIVPVGQSRACEASAQDCGVGYEEPRAAVTTMPSFLSVARRVLIRSVMLVTVSATVCLDVSGAQEPGGVAVEGTPATAAGGQPAAVREEAPELYYLQDDAGRLVPVPGFRYADFLELFRMREGLGGPGLPPAAVLESVVVTIDARGLEPGARSCPVAVECRVRQTRAGWAMVPLELGQVLLDLAPTHDGPGRMLVDADPDGKGYRCWFEPPADGVADLRHTVRLAGRLPVEAGAEQESFGLTVPLAVTSRIDVETSRVEPQVTLRPALAGRVETSAEATGGRVSVTGVVAAVRILISTAARAGAAESLAEADCESVVRIDGRTARITARLTLASLPPALTKIEVELPPRAVLRRVAGDGTLVVAGAAANTVTIEVGRDGSDAAEIDLECEHPVDPSGGTPLEPLGFAVSGIEPWRQRGRASLVIEGDWQATWDDEAGIRLVDPPPGEREAGLVAAFAYDAQPASLPLRIRPRRSRVVIEPEYRYEVSTARIALQARLRVAVRGAPVGSLSLGLDPGWRLGEVGPAGVVDAAAIRVEGNRVTIPFVQPLAGDAIVDLAAVLAVEPDAERVGWSLPVPRGDLIGPANVIVSSQPDIELLPSTDGSVGLVRQTSSALPAGDAERMALVYRLDAPEGVFAAERRFLPRRVEAAVVARVTIDEREIAVLETIRLDVLHLPLEFFELRLADVVIESGTLEIRQAGELLDPADVEETGEVDAVGRPLKLVRTLLPVPLLGRGEVTVQYRLATPPIPRQATVALDLPLPLPVVSGSIRQVATIEEAATLAVVPRGDTWRRDVATTPGGGRTWSVPTLKNLLPLALSARAREAAGVTVVEAAWLRTRLFPDRREDVAAYVIAPAESQIEITLPAEQAVSAVEVRVDGSPVPLAARDDGRLAIDIATPGGGSRLVEVRTTSPWGGTVAGLGLPWPLPLAAPRFATDVLERQFSWEVSIMSDDNLLGLPTRWTSQQQWRWAGLGWRGTPTVTTAELADWVAGTLGRPAVAVSAAAPQQEHRLVYTGIGSPGDVTAWVVPTWLIVLAASGAVLAIGLGMVYRAAWRRPTVVLGLAAAGALSGVALPETTALIGQAAMPGMLLAMLAAGLRWLTDRRPAKRPAWQPTGQASSLTRSAAPTVSLIVTPSTGSASAAGAGRGAS